MNYYTATISVPLAEKLKEKGMPITMSNHLHQIAPNVRGVVQANFKEIDCPTYAEVFDYLLERDIRIHLLYVPKSDLQDELWRGIVGLHMFEGTWHDAATKAIEKALDLIKP